MSTITHETSPWDVVEKFLDLHAKMERRQAAEDRAFERYMNGAGTAGSARKAKSRTNALSTVLWAAEHEVYELMDRVGDDFGDPLRFAREYHDKHRGHEEHAHCSVCHGGVHRYPFGWQHTNIPDQAHEPVLAGIHCSCGEAK